MHNVCWLVILLWANFGTAVIPPLAPHECQPPYKGQVPDVYCAGTFTYEQALCGLQSLSASQRAERLDVFFPTKYKLQAQCSGFYAGAVFQMRAVSNRNLQQDETGQWKLVPVTLLNNPGPISGNVCQPGQQLLLNIEGFSWLPGYMAGCHDWKTGILVPDCLPGRFQPPLCSLTCQPVADCGPHGDCFYNANQMKRPTCICQPDYLGVSCDFSISNCFTNFNQTICAQRGLCV